MSAGRVGLFSSLTSGGSRELLRAVLRAMADGALGGAEAAFLLVDRGPGEAAETDASVAALAAAFPQLPILRESAAGFEADRRKAARAAGDQAALEAWRDAFYARVAPRLPRAELDLLLGDMWIWGPAECAARRGVNLHPSLPSGPLGKMWFDVVWDLIAQEAPESGVMLHRVTTAVDQGPVVAWCRFSLRGPKLDPLWALLPTDPVQRADVIARERALRRESTHPLFRALRAAGYARELPLILETVRAVGEGRLRLTADGVEDDAGRALPGGLELSAAVEERVEADRGLASGATGSKDRMGGVKHHLPSA